MVIVRSAVNGFVCAYRYDYNYDVRLYGKLFELALYVGNCND